MAGPGKIGACKRKLGNDKSQQNTEHVASSTCKQMTIPTGANGARLVEEVIQPNAMSNSNMGSNSIIEDVEPAIEENMIDGTKSISRRREEDGSNIGVIELYRQTRFSKNKDVWVNDKARENYEKMKELQDQFVSLSDDKLDAQSENVVTRIEEEICMEVLGEKSSFVHSTFASTSRQSAKVVEDIERIKMLEEIAQNAER